MKPELHGVAASFTTPESFLEALRAMRRAGYLDVEVNVPFAVEGMEEWLPGRPTPIARVVLIAALAGAAGGYFMQWYAARDYALNIGGRPLHSWPAFVPITFELSVLTGAVIGVLGLLWLARLPRLDYPLFQVPEFVRATQDRFFVGIKASDARFDPEKIRAEFATLHPETIVEVPA